jgi:hypothetical protein
LIEGLHDGGAAGGGEVLEEGLAVEGFSADVEHLLDELVGFEDEALEVGDDVAVGGGVEELAIAFAFFVEFFKGEEELVVLGAEFGLGVVEFVEGGLESIDEFGEVAALVGGELLEIGAQGFQAPAVLVVGARF